MKIYLKEIEINEGLDLDKLALGNDSIYQINLKMILEMLCKCLSETYAYDSNQLEYIKPEIQENLEILVHEDMYLVANEFNIELYDGLVKVKS